MANYAFLNIWCRNYSIENMLDLYERLLSLFPSSEKRPGFYSFTVRGLSPQESPILEQDAATPVEPAILVAQAREFLHDDCAYETVAYWDLWRYTMDRGEILWRAKPTRVEFACLGVKYDEGAFQESGHFCLQLNLEHLYTGHGELLTDATPHSPLRTERLEREFSQRMEDLDAREEYRRKTRANVLKLLHYVAQVEKRLPVERHHLWSEGEPDFEAKLRRIHSG